MKRGSAGKPDGVTKLFSVFGGKTNREEFPLLPLRDMVLFPQTILPVYITYKSGIAAVEEALKRDMRLFAAPLKAPSEPGVPADTYGLGSVVRIVQYLRLPDSTYRVVLHGELRGSVASLRKEKGCTIARIAVFTVPDRQTPPGPENLALLRSVQKAFAQYAEYSKKVSTETISSAEKTENPERLCNIIANALVIKTEKKAALLAHGDETKRLTALLEALELENEILGIQKNISGKVKSRMDKNQREYILNEQLKEIHRELGKENTEDEFAELERAIEERRPGDEVLFKARKELAKLRKLQPFSPEAGVLRGYLEWIADLPWNGNDAGGDPGAAAGAAGGDAFEENADGNGEAFEENAGADGPPRGEESLARAERILEEDHYGMEKAKERILEFIAVQELSGGKKSPLKGPILCFVGPPGTGKTSLGKSVARALDRRFVRISLGGVRDEAEIRGHRKTYVGALPGKIIQSMRKAGELNPVFLLDEIDKLSSDFRGDPASALLEVLDPEQNNAFTDHYLELPYDLSRVLFIATANSLHPIPYPLLDRMEIIEIPGYGEREKLSIAKRYLVPKELEANGLKDSKILYRDEAILAIIRHWTMESGVRGLEREIARCARRIARKAVENGYGLGKKPVSAYKKTIRAEDLEKLLGRRRYKRDLVVKEARVGVVYGLAWTETGGAILPVETKSYNGNGELVITGNLGDVMKESARIALSYLRSEQDSFKFLVKDMGKTDFHIHVPEGAIPKDGPSAGVTLAASLLSTLCGAAPRPGIAMTGELTLTGRILPIGGLKEKVLAAIRNGMEKVLVPLENKEDWNELDKDIRSSIGAEFVENAQEAFRIIFRETLYRGTQTAKRARPAAKRPSR
ncbi:MAG: endopeptidase La [Treponema sp.]|jgi:ATP-dependent Lon protease|nr:endopeptidase La [Treponema sp.]